MHCRSLLALVGLPLLVATAGAQDTIPTATHPPAATTETPKRPTTARIVGLLPGAGHIYAGEVGTGFAYAGGMAGVAMIGSAAVVRNCFRNAVTLTCPSHTEITTIATLAFVGIWGWSIFDAGRAAQRTNIRRQLSASAIIAPSLVPMSAVRDGLSIKFGLSVTTP